MKKKIRLTESQLTSLVKTTLTKVLNEDGAKPKSSDHMSMSSKDSHMFEIRSLLFAVRDEIKYSNSDEELKDEIQRLIKKAIIHLEKLR